MITQQARLPFPTETTNKPTSTRAEKRSHRPIALYEGNENLKSCKSSEDKTQIDKGRAKITHELKLEDDSLRRQLTISRGGRTILASSSNEDERKEWGWEGKRVCCNRSLAAINTESARLFYVVNKVFFFLLKSK